jgi:Tlde1 domain
MAWTYEQKTGRLLRDGIYFATGYAGRGVGKNNPQMQDAKGIGPLPCGWYTAEAPRDDEVVGKYAMPLVPDASNEMFGRTSFFMHGDDKEHPGLASHGCMVMGLFIRRSFWLSGDHRIQVVSGEDNPSIA